MKKSGISIIGGADGPTSVYIAGRKLSFKNRIRRILNRYKRKIVSSRIKPSSHTLKEVILLIKEKYGATEVSKQDAEYIEHRNIFKESMVLSKMPELLGDLKVIPRPVTLNEDTIRQMETQIELRRKVVAEIPDDLIPMDFHIYEISKEIGKMKIVIDFKWDIVSCDYSGSKKEMKQLKKIAREIYLYYGVTEEDIRNKTERFSILVTVLTT